MNIRDLLVMGLIEFTEFPENSVAPPFLCAGQFHLAGFVDQDFVLGIETFANVLDSETDAH